MHNWQSLTVDGHTLAYHAYNEHLNTPPIIFIHGILGSIDFWELVQTPEIAQHYRWYSLSLPGHYPAQLPAGYNQEDVSAQSLADVMMQAIEQIVPEGKFIVGGFSTGGFMALNIAAHYPERVAGVLCLSGFAQGTWIKDFGIMQKAARAGVIGRSLFRTTHYFLGLNEPVFRLGYKTLIVHYDRIQPSKAAFAEFCRQLYPKRAKISTNHMLPFFQKMPEIDITPQLSAIRVPTLILAGEKDTVVPSSQATHIAQHIPTNSLTMIPDIGHMLVWENPAVYHRAITEWLLQFKVV